MPTVSFQERAISCEAGETLRDVLLRGGLSPHNGKAALFNCRGLGTCGTCAVEISGPVSELTAREKWRLNFPPHRQPSKLRLACQTHVLGDIEVKKHEGFWGQNVPVEASKPTAQ